MKLRTGPPAMAARTGWVVALAGAALLGALQAAAAADPDPAVADAARAARIVLAARLEPSPVQLPALCVADHGVGAPMRAYVLQQQALAVEALAQAPTARRLLDDLARNGASNDAVALLADRAPGGAVGLRLAMSLVELPAALQDDVRADCVTTTTAGLLSRSGRPLREQARIDAAQLVERAPDDPWSLLVHGWLAGTQGEASLLQALQRAHAAGGDDGALAEQAALQRIAWLRLRQQRPQEAVDAAVQAMSAAQAALQPPPAGADATAAPDAAARLDRRLATVLQAGQVLSAVQAEAGDRAGALALLDALLPTLRQRAEARADDVMAQYALIEALLREAALRGDAGAKAPLDEALARHRALAMRTPFSPMVARSAWSGLFMTAAVAAAVLTLVAGWLLMLRYQRRVAALMQATSARSIARPPGAAPGTPASARPAVIRLEPVTDVASPLTAPVLRTATAHLRRAACVQAIAGVAFGLVAAFVLLRADGTAPNVNRMAILVWIWGAPAVLALAEVFDGDRRRQAWAWAGYVVGLLAICTHVALGDTPAMDLWGVRVPAFFQGLVAWALTLSFTPLLLLFLNRRVRSVGPALLLMMLVVMAGGVVTEVAGSTPAAMVAVVAIGSALHLPAAVGTLLPLAVGMLLSAPLAWWVGRRLAAAFARGWFSDQGLVIDAIWAFQSVLFAFELVQAIGAPGVAGVAIFGVYKLITWAGLRGAAREAERQPPLRLLLLRVFQRRDRAGRPVSRRTAAERLFDRLSARWRYAGPITMIGAPDLAVSTLDPDEFLQFLAGDLAQRFTIEPGDVEARLAALDLRCDFDARWRVAELFCGNDTWQSAVRGLMARSDAVAMDLRDFGPQNQGCVFELQSLLERVPAGRVALLVDGSTDQAFLRSTLEACGARVTAGSPNAGRKVAIAGVDVGAGEAVAVERLMQWAAGVATLAAADPPAATAAGVGQDGPARYL